MTTVSIIHINQNKTINTMNRLTNYALIFLTTILLQACASSSSTPQSVSKDAQIIEKLQDAGKDLSKARNIEFFLYFPKQKDAEKAAHQLKEEGYKIELSKDDFKKMWLVLASKKITPNEATLSSLRQKFETMTSQAGGKYLDWGTPMVE